MKLRSPFAVFALGLTLTAAGPIPLAKGFAQTTNEQTRKETKAELKQQKRADKTQAKADKSEEKLAGSKQAKKAARQQDRANAAQPQ